MMQGGATTMHEFDALCLTPVKELATQKIRRLRLKYSVCQSVFAAFLNVSPSTVQKWESDQKRPNGPSLKLLSLVKDKGPNVQA